MSRSVDEGFRYRGVVHWGVVRLKAFRNFCRREAAHMLKGQPVEVLQVHG